MEVNSNSQQTTPNALGNVQRPGEYLRHIRVTQKHTLAEVSQALKMPLKTIEALEKDDYTALPEPMFIKGYYRSYAKFLNVDASGIIQRFDEIYVSDTGLRATQALKDSPIKIMGRLPGSNSARNRKWLKVIGAIFVVVLVLWLLVMGFQKWSNRKVATPETTATSVVQNNTQVLPVASTAVKTTGDALVVQFKRPAAVNIVDSTGKVLAAGRQSETLNLNGESPFQIRLDDAQAVSSLTLNNESIPLSIHTVNGKADFRLSR